MGGAPQQPSYLMAGDLTTRGDSVLLSFRSRMRERRRCFFSCSSSLPAKLSSSGVLPALRAWGRVLGDTNTLSKDEAVLRERPADWGVELFISAGRGGGGMEERERVFLMNQ